MPSKDGADHTDDLAAVADHHLKGLDVVWAREQTYLLPYPDDLRLRHSVDV